MAEHTRGHSREGMRSNERNSRNDSGKNISNDRLQSSNRNDNSDASSSMNRRSAMKGPRMNTKWDLSSSDYDGQLSDE